MGERCEKTRNFTFRDVEFARLRRYTCSLCTSLSRSRYSVRHATVLWKSDTDQWLSSPCYVIVDTAEQVMGIYDLIFSVIRAIKFSKRDLYKTPQKLRGEFRLLFMCGLIPIYYKPHYVIDLILLDGWFSFLVCHVYMTRTCMRA